MSATNVAEFSNPDKPSKKSKPLGNLSMYGFGLLIVIGAIALQGFNGFGQETSDFLLGKTERIPVFSIREAAGSLLAGIIVTLALAVPTGLLVRRLLGKVNDHAVMKELLPGSEKPMFANFYLTILFIEEGVARWLFFGYLYQFSWLHNPIGFWLLFLVGNGLFAIFHLVNYKQEDRHLLRVLPQFVASIPLTWVFMKYGFLGVFIVHFAYDCVLFASIKAQKFDKKDLAISCLGAIYALLAILWLVFSGHSLSQLSSWLSVEPTFKLEGWTFLDYLALLVLFDGATDLIFGLLAFDRPNLTVYRQMKERLLGNSETWLSQRAMVGWLVLVLTNAVFLTFVALAGNWLLGFVIDNYFLRSFVLASAICFLHVSESGSALARSFFEHVPELMVLVASFYALGFWWTIPMVALWGLLQVPSAIMVSYDD